VQLLRHIFFVPNLKFSRLPADRGGAGTPHPRGLPANHPLGTTTDHTAVRRQEVTKPSERFGPPKGPTVSHEAITAPRRTSTRRLATALIGAAAVIGLGALPSLGFASMTPTARVSGLHAGIMPTRAIVGVSRASDLRGLGTNAANATPVAGSQQVAYQGGLNGEGVVTGAPRVYVIFWGSQWGSRSTTSLNGATYASFSGDPAGVAPQLQAFYAGLGTNGETWSGVLTQYCQSSSIASVATGALSCPVGATPVGYPTGGALAGVWADNSASAPAAATQAQIAQEALRAAGHFGNTTDAANRNAQYIVVSPTGTTPDGFNTPSGGFCAWHDYTADGFSGISSSGFGVQFTNMPYIPDAGYTCGANYVNAGSAGANDGVTVIASHEYAETLTDGYLGAGWYNTNYGEIADLCSWAPVDQAGGGNLVLATGTFPVTGVWGNDANNGTGGCEMAHPIISNSGVRIANPGTQTSLLASPVTPLVITADSLSSVPTTAAGTAGATPAQLSYRAIGLPAGLRIDSQTGQISGTPRRVAAAKMVTIVATDTSGGIGITRFIWKVANPLHIAHIVSRRVRRGHQLRLRPRVRDAHTAATVSYHYTGLPTGLRYNRHTGILFGAAHRTGKFRVTVVVRDSLGCMISTSFKLRVV